MFTFNHTPHTNKQIIEYKVTSSTTNIGHGANYSYLGPRNGPTPHEHVVYGHHIVMGKAQPTHIHLSTLVGMSCLPIWTVKPYAQPYHVLWVSI
jgi:hypothetical protein